VHGCALVNGVTAHAESAGDRLRLNRKTARNAFQHQALLERRLAGSINALGQMTLGLGTYANHDFNVFELISQGQQQLGFFLDFLLQVTALGKEGLIVYPDRLMQDLKISDLGLQRPHFVIQPMDHQGPAKDGHKQPAADASQQATHQLAQSEMPRAFVVSYCYLVAVTHKLMILICCWLLSGGASFGVNVIAGGYPVYS
jgi:hypothetical protein